MLPEESLGLHPLLVGLLRRLADPISWVYVLKLGVLRFLVNQVGADELESVGGLIALGALLCLIVPDSALEILIDSNEGVVLVEVDANDCGGVMIKKLPELVYFHVLGYLLGLEFYCLLFLQGEWGLLLFLNLRHHRHIKRQVGLRILNSVHVHVVL